MQPDERWVNAEITLTVPLEVPVDAPAVTKQEAVAVVIDALMERVGSIAEHVASGRWVDMPPPLSDSGERAGALTITDSDGDELKLRRHSNGRLLANTVHRGQRDATCVILNVEDQRRLARYCSGKREAWCGCGDEIVSPTHCATCVMLLEDRPDGGERRVWIGWERDDGHWASDEELRDLARSRLFGAVSALVNGLMEREGIGRSALAKRIGKTPAFVTQVLDGDRNMTLKTLSDLLHGLGYAPTLTTDAQSSDGGEREALLERVREALVDRERENRALRLAIDRAREKQRVLRSAIERYDASSLPDKPDLRAGVIVAARKLITALDASVRLASSSPPSSGEGDDERANDLAKAVQTALRAGLWADQIRTVVERELPRDLMADLQASFASTTGAREGRDAPAREKVAIPPQVMKEMCNRFMWAVTTGPSHPDATAEKAVETIVKPLLDHFGEGGQNG